MVDAWVRACRLAMDHVVVDRGYVYIDVRAICDIFAAARGQDDVDQLELESHLIEQHRIEASLATRFGDIYQSVDHVLVDGPNLSWGETELERAEGQD